MGLHAEDLPPALRARLEQELASGTIKASKSKHAQRKAAPGRGWVRCATCDERFEWTTNTDATPAAVTRHANATGHARFATEVTRL